MKYHYRDLNAARREIRILEFEPAHDPSSPYLHQGRHDTGRALKCRLSHVFMDDIVEQDYETISYHWGDPTPCENIMVDACTLQIPLRTERALRKAVILHKSSRLWIDAICINQADSHERTQQVALIGHIYSSAIGNIVYLGEGNRSTRAALENICALAAEVRGNVGDNSSLHDFMKREAGHYNHSDHAIRTAVDEAALKSFFSNPWFSRVWVVQEVTLARKNYFLLDQHEADMEDIFQVASWLRIYHAYRTPLALVTDTGLDTACQIWQCRDRTQLHRNSPDLIDLIQLGQALAVTDARDKIFGMLALLRGGL